MTLREDIDIARTGYIQDETQIEQDMTEAGRRQNRIKLMQDVNRTGCIQDETEIEQNMYKISHRQNIDIDRAGQK